MTTFQDGPAAGKTFTMRRAPLLLRVTRKPNGEFDHLDQLEDTPERHEEIFAYAMVKFIGRMHLLVRGKERHRSGFYENAEYRLVEPQPFDAKMRDNEAWRAWTEANRHLVAHIK